MPEAPQEPKPEMFGLPVQTALAHLEVLEGALQKFAPHKQSSETALALLIGGVISAFCEAESKGDPEPIASLVHAYAEFAKNREIGGKKVGDVVEEMLKAEQFRNN